MSPERTSLRARAAVLLRNPILWGVVATILLLAINVAKVVFVTAAFLFQ